MTFAYPLYLRYLRSFLKPLPGAPGKPVPEVPNYATNLRSTFWKFQVARRTGSTQVYLLLTYFHLSYTRTYTSSNWATYKAGPCPPDHGQVRSPPGPEPID